MGFAWVSLHLKGTLAGESFTSFRNWLALGGAASEGSARPQMSKLRKIQKIKRHD